MVEDGLSKKQAEQKMSGLKVETFGAAAKKYPDGPQYVHYVNKRDGVPQTLGVGSAKSDPGKDARVREFKAGVWPAYKAHGFDDVYLDKRVPFEEAYGASPARREGGIPSQVAEFYKDRFEDSYVEPFKKGAEWGWKRVEGLGDKLTFWNQLAWGLRRWRPPWTPAPWPGGPG